MKKLIVICVVAGLILAAGDVAQAAPTTTGWMSPTANYSPNIIGDLGFNTPPGPPIGAYADSGTGVDGYAEAWPYGHADKEQYYGYGFSVPVGATINGIEVRMDAWRNSYATTGSMTVDLSWDGGISWTPTAYSTGNLYEGEWTYYEGGASDTWGRTLLDPWTADEINNSFRVRLIAAASGGTNGRVYLDWVPVRVTYDTVTSTVIPAPAAVLLGGIGVVLVGWLRRRRTL
jgi:hypothetical protein